MPRTAHAPLAALLAALAACAALAAGGCQPDEEGHAMTAPPQENAPSAEPQKTPSQPAPDAGAEADRPESTARATFAAGCFWGVEVRFRRVHGVVDTRVGYTGGHTERPDYEQVCTGATGHAEAVQVTYDPRKVTYEQLLEVFWSGHDPTTPNRQGPDVGSQYRSAVFYHSREQEASARESKAAAGASGTFGDRPIVTQIEPAPTFWPAEPYHQRYLEKKGRASCAP